MEGGGADDWTRGSGTTTTLSPTQRWCFWGEGEALDGGKPEERGARGHEGTRMKRYSHRHMTDEMLLMLLAVVVVALLLLLSVHPHPASTCQDLFSSPPRPPFLVRLGSMQPGFVLVACLDTCPPARPPAAAARRTH